MNLESSRDGKYFISSLRLISSVHLAVSAVCLCRDKVSAISPILCNRLSEAVVKFYHIDEKNFNDIISTPYFLKPNDDSAIT